MRAKRERLKGSARGRAGWTAAGFPVKASLAAWAVLSFSLAISAFPSLWNWFVGAYEAAGRAGPFSGTALAFAVAGHVMAFCGIPLILAFAWGAGRPVERLLRSATDFTGSNILTLACGWGSIALIQHGLGLTGLFSLPVLRSEAVLFVVLGSWGALRRRGYRVGITVDRAAALPASLAVLLVGAVFLMARLPDVPEDARVYQFAAPEQYLLLHKISAEPQHISMHMPRGAEMAFLIPWQVCGIDGAKLVNVCWLLVLLMVVIRLAGSLGSDRTGGMWAAVLAGSAGLVIGEAWGGKNDLAETVGVAGAAWCAIEGVRKGGRWWLMCGWLMGQAVGVKYTAGFFALGLLAAVAGIAGKAVMGANGGFPAVMKRSAVISLAFGAPFAGWLAESYLFLGNPFFPFLSGLIPSLGWGPGYAREWHEAMVWQSPENAKGALDVLGGVWRVLGDPAVGNPGLFACLPLVLAAGIRRPAGPLVVLMAGSYICWTATERVARYMFPLVPLAAALCGSAEPRQPARWRAWMGLAGFLSAIAGTASFTAPSCWGVLTGQVGRGEYLAGKYTTWWTAIGWINANVPSAGRVLFTGEDRRLWVQRRVRSGAMVAEPLLWRLTNDSFEVREVRKRLKQLGITHQLFNFVLAECRGLSWNPGPPWSMRQLRLYSDFARRHLKPVCPPARVDYNNGGFYIYEITRLPARDDFPLYYLPGTEGYFRKAFLLFDSGKHREALEKAERAAAGLHDVAGSRLILAMLYEAMRDNNRVFGITGEINKTGFIGDGNFTAFGRDALEKGRVAVAIKALCRAYLLTRDPGVLLLLSRGFYCRALESMKRMEYDKTARDLDRATSCAPSDPALLYHEALLLEHMRRYPEALGCAQRARALASEDGRVADLVKRLRKTVEDDSAVARP